MAKDYRQRDTPTERIEQIAESAARAAVAAQGSGEHQPPPPCNDHARRIADLEATTDDHGKSLAAGDVGFAELRKDVGMLAEKVGGLTTAAWWLIGVLILGVLGTAGTALVWVIAHMGKP